MQSKRNQAGKSGRSQIASAINEFKVPEEFCYWAKEYLKVCHEKETSQKDRYLENHHKNYQANEKKLDRLIEMKMDGLITREEFTKKRNKIIEDQRTIKEKLKGTDKQANDWRSLAEKTFELAQNASTWFQEGTLEEKNEILLTIGTDFILKDKEIQIKWREPYQILREQNPKIWQYREKEIEFLKEAEIRHREGREDKRTPNSQISSLEPLKNGVTTTKKDPHLDENCEWRARRDSNPGPADSKSDALSS